MLPVRGVPFALSAGQRWLTVVGLAGANSVALHYNIRRYVNGADAPSLNLNTGVKWWWGIPISPDAVWLIGTMAFAGGLALVSLALRPPLAVPVNGLGEGFATVLVPDGRDPSEWDGEAPGDKSIDGRAPAGLAPVKGEGVEQSDGYFAGCRGVGVWRAKSSPLVLVSMEPTLSGGSGPRRWLSRQRCCPTRTGTGGVA